MFQAQGVNIRYLVNEPNMQCLLIAQPSKVSSRDIEYVTLQSLWFCTILLIWLFVSALALSQKRMFGAG
jgi:hypothetical protein